MVTIAFTNPALFFGFLTFWMVLITLTGLVSSSLLIQSTDQSYAQIIDDMYEEAGFFQTVFLWIATFLLGVLDFDAVGVFVLGFASLPEWLNALLFIPLAFMTLFALAVSLIPAVG